MLRTSAAVTGSRAFGWSGSAQVASVRVNARPSGTSAGSSRARAGSWTRPAAPSMAGRTSPSKSRSRANFSESVRAYRGDINSGRLRTPTTSTPVGGGTPGPSAGAAGGGLGSSSSRGGGLTGLAAGSSSSFDGGALPFGGAWAGSRSAAKTARSRPANNSQRNGPAGGRRRGDGIGRIRG